MHIDILLGHFLKLSYKKYVSLMEFFGNPEILWSATQNDLREARVDETFIHEFLEWRAKVNPDILQKVLDKENITAIPISSDNYPALLKQIYDPPLCLFVRGTLKQAELPLAIVGTRKNSPYGKQVAEELVQGLVRAGVTIVSGLALGIDGIVHQATLKQNGITWAVLGTGIDNAHIYPRAHFGLATQIIEHGGAIISEYPPNFTVGGKYTFARRNRIIAGLSRGTLVIEAPQSSGSLITAHSALDANREVFAVPQNITAVNASGPHTLIKMGAHIVTTANDILRVFGMCIKDTNSAKIVAGSPTEAALLACLSREPTSIDSIIKASKLESHTVLSTLTLMEIKGMVKNLGAMAYILG
jgi:DNA processing protein